MVVGTGIDLVEIARIRRAVERHGDRFLNRVFTADERAYCLRLRYPERHLAARFAAKEAALKALGTGVSLGIRWRDVEVRRGRAGRPEIEFHNVAAEMMAAVAATTAHLSLSHTDYHAIALVILESQPEFPSYGGRDG